MDVYKVWCVYARQAKLYIVTSQPQGMMLQKPETRGQKKRAGFAFPSYNKKDNIHSYITPVSEANKKYDAIFVHLHIIEKCQQ